MPGVVSEIQADYYGHILEALVGLYFSEEKIDSNSKTYHSVVADFYNATQVDVCGISTPYQATASEYFTISPGMVNTVILVHEDDENFLKN